MLRSAIIPHFLQKICCALTKPSTAERNIQFHIFTNFLLHSAYIQCTAQDDHFLPFFETAVVSITLSLNYYEERLILTHKLYHG